MRIATFNLHNGGSAGHWSRVLERTDADLFFAQESRDPADFLPEITQRFGFHSAVWEVVPSLKRARWGSAVLSTSSSIEPIVIPDFQGWVVGGRLLVGSTGIFAFSVHIPTRKGAGYLTQANRLVDRLVPIVAGAPVILGGDWNVTAGHRRADESKQNTRSELRWLDRLRGELGVVPAWSTFHAEAHLPQTLRWVCDPLPAYHCDGIFLPAAWADHIRRVAILAGEEWNRLSDHNPVLVELDERGL
jgi:endonuclease/exonuclease/phosphatase family metal-dependent hydrolase